MKGTFELLTISESVSIEDSLLLMFEESKPIPPEIKNFQGIRIEIPGFSSYYLRYNSNKWFIINMVNSLPYQKSIELPPDVDCEKSDGFEAATFTPQYTDVLNDTTFWQPEEIDNKEYYSCFKFPWKHTLMFDRTSDTVYHVIEEIRE